MVRLLLTTVALVACGGSSATAPDPTTDRSTSGDEKKPASEDKLDCRSAQVAELKAWIAEMVTDPDDELEMFTALGMILTLTDPETLDEIREANPEAMQATNASEQAWNACGEKELVNCPALAQVMFVTETRLESKVWDHEAIDSRCWNGEFNLEHADCALAASEIGTAKTCF